MNAMNEVELLQRVLHRERLARKEAEQLLENKSRELYLNNCELKAIAAELKDEVCKTQTIMNSAAEGMIVFSTKGIVESFNPAAENIFGIQSSEALQKHFCKLVPSVDGCDPTSCFQPTSETFLISKKNQVAEYFGVHHEGHAIPLEIAFSEVTHGDETLYLAIVRDLTRRKQLESHLAQSQKLEAVGQLATGIAHEINTPIQYVGDNTRFLQTSFQELDQLLELAMSLMTSKDDSSNVEIAAKMRDLLNSMDIDFLREEIPQAIDQALEGAETVTKLVRAMKEFSHPGSVDKQTVDLNRILESTLTVTRNEWKYVCDLESDLAPDLPSVPCYPQDIKQAILNIIVNAAHAVEANLGSGEKGKLRVRTRMETEWAVIEIKDSGCGIPVQIRHRVFDPFFTTKSVGKGTGQGLAIAYNAIVNRHHGKIEFESKEGVGTTFTIRLPWNTCS